VAFQSTHDQQALETFYDGFGGRWRWRGGGGMGMSTTSLKSQFPGLLAFFCAFSVDGVLHTQFGNWHSGVEPYGFLALVVCLWYVTTQRVIANEGRLVSLTDEMRAATRIQEAILPARPPSLENAQIAVRYAPMTAVAGDLYEFPAVRPNCIGVLVAEAMGHGVPAALIASMIKAAVSTQRGHDDERAMCHRWAERRTRQLFHTSCASATRGASPNKPTAARPAAVWDTNDLRVIGSTLSSWGNWV
jgi:hypothetical protein